MNSEVVTDWKEMGIACLKVAGWFCGENKGNHENPQNILGAAQIRTGSLSNTVAEYYHYSSLFSTCSCMHFWSTSNNWMDATAWS